MDARDGIIGWKVVAAQIEEKPQISEWSVIKQFVCFADEMFTHQEPALEEILARANPVSDIRGISASFASRLVRNLLQPLCASFGGGSTLEHLQLLCDKAVFIGSALLYPLRLGICLPTSKCLRPANPTKALHVLQCTLYPRQEALEHNVYDQVQSGLSTIIVVFKRGMASHEAWAQSGHCCGVYHRFQSAPMDIFCRDVWSAMVSKAQIRFSFVLGFILVNTLALFVYIRIYSGDSGRPSWVNEIKGSVRLAGIIRSRAGVSREFNFGATLVDELGDIAEHSSFRPISRISARNGEQKCKRHCLPVRLSNKCINHGCRMACERHTRRVHRQLLGLVRPATKDLFKGKSYCMNTWLRRYRYHFDVGPLHFLQDLLSLQNLERTVSFMPQRKIKSLVSFFYNCAIARYFPDQFCYPVGTLLPCFQWAKRCSCAFACHGNKSFQFEALSRLDWRSTMLPTRIVASIVVIFFGGTLFGARASSLGFACETCFIAQPLE
ncbi:hypothetical protein MSAN_00717000 [Mycena sanguinolenta]|uniref:Uncharacterized protein n=1 Tax=Mycena sanguinolenta TaxID=230812 RepID=A0A8H6Z1D0_9AGAR|nr:hypothetical protein MSAN_00717000 [Mycena sanguinolenta]